MRHSPLNAALAYRISHTTGVRKLKIWKSLTLCFFVVFSFSAQAISEMEINNELKSRVSCKDREVENLCFLSTDNRNEELVVYMSSASYRMDAFNKTDSFFDAANLAHQVYGSIDSLAASITSGERNELPIVLVMEVIFKGERVTVIHDTNNTVFVDLDKRIDIYQLLNEHRKMVSEAVENQKEQKTLKAGENLVSKYEVTNTYNVVSSDAVKDNNNGEVKLSGKYESEGKKVTYTKATHYIVWYPLTTS